MRSLDILGTDETLPVVSKIQLNAMGNNFILPRNALNMGGTAHSLWKRLLMVSELS